MENPIKVSIIVPVYKVEQYLRQCVDSLLGQTLKEIEVILVDDGSPDNCPAICDEYARKDSRVRVLHKQNEGLGMARNSGMELARGEYVTFVDSDDYVDLDTYEITYRAAKELNLPLLRFAMNSFIVPGKFPYSCRDLTPVIYVGRQQLITLGLSLFGTPPGTDRSLNIGGSACTILIRRTLLEESGLKFESERNMISEDYQFCYRLMLLADRLGFIPTTFYHYRQNPKSLTTSPQPNFLDRVQHFVDEMEKEMTSDGIGHEAAMHMMAYALIAMRAKIKPIMLSETLTTAEKKEWLQQASKHPLVRRIDEQYPWRKMSWNHRASFRFLSNADYRSLQALVRGIIIYRKIKGKR